MKSTVTHVNLCYNKKWKNEAQVIKFMKKESLKQKAYNIIKKKIVTCEYPPNMLLNEEELKDEIGASRTPVRDALSRLEQEKLVHILPKKGVVVASLTIGQINDVYEARMLVEPYAIENYAYKLGRERFEYYREIFMKKPDNVQKVKYGMEKQYETDDQFHIEIINAMENEYIHALYERILVQNYRLRVLSGVKNTRRIEDTYKEHLIIVGACLREEWSDAAEAMREHLLNSKRAAFEALFNDGQTLL